LVRQVDCQAGEKHTAGLEFDTASNAVKVFWDGKVIADWENPAKEWAGVAPQYKNELEKLAAPRAVSENDAFFIHCMKTGISISGFSLSGRKCSELKIGQPHKSIGPYVSDTEFKRLAPAAPVKVGPLKNDMKGIPEIAAETALCGKYVLYCSNPVSLYFKITAPGFYTVKTEMSALKNLPQILSVGLNGTAISNELYRGLTPGMACAIIKDYVPLELSPGVYRLDLALSPELIDKCAPDLKETASRIVIDSVKIQSGLVKPEYVISAKNPQPAAAMKEPAENSELFGKDLRFILKGIVPGKYNLELGFYDVIADRPGQRLMDVFVGGRKIFGNLDVVKEAGDQKFLVKSIPVEASGGDLVIDLTGINFQAFINSIELKDGNKTIISHKPGWTPNISAPRRMRPEIPQNAVAANSIFPGINADPAKVPAPKINYFEGHNLIANPSFTFKENDGKPMWWRSVAELTDKINPDLFGGLLAGKGSYAVDGTNSFSPPSSLKIWNTDSKFALTCNFIYTNPNKRQKFSARVKTQNAKKSFLEIYWLSIDSYRYHMGSAALRVIETTRSAELSGDQPWTLLEAVAVPPPGTNMVAMMIRADSGPDGAVWVDDAAFDGYGAEPLEISYSHLGFEPSGWKSAVIRSVANKPVKIRLCRADGQIIIDKIDTELKKMHFPDRYYCEFDFSAISTPENYYLSALQEGIEVKTPVFAVKSGIYRDLTSLLLEGMRVKHFNDDTPGFHEPGWLGDFMVQKTLDRFNYPRKLSAKRYNLLKGHHDAGDRMKGYHWFPNIMFGPLNALALVKPEIKKYSANDALAELKEAADGLVNAQTEDGAFFSQIHRVYPYDNIPGFERPSYILGVIGMPQAAGALAMTAFYGGGDDPAFRKRCLDAAKRNYDFTVEGWELYGGKEAKDPVNILRYSPKIIWAALYLWKTTGDDVYKKNMDAALDALLPVLRDKAYCRSDFAKHIVTNFETCALLDFIWAPLWVVKEDPGHPKRREIEETFKIFAGEVERLSAMNPWKSAVLSPADVAEPPEYYDSTSGHMVWLALAYCLALGSDVFDDHSWAMLAERQFQWRLGRNAHDFCEVTGVGGRSIERGDFMIYDPEYFTRYLKSDRKTYSYPGMTGVGGLGRVADGSLYYNQEKRCLFGYIWGYPRGYLWRYILSSGSPLSAEYNESFLVVSGSFLSTASALSAAYDRHAIRVPDSRTAATDNRPFKQPSK